MDRKTVRDQKNGDWKNGARKLLVILLGNMIYSAGVAFFVIPYDMLTGGTTGLALILQRFLEIPIPLFVAIFNVITFLLGLWILGWSFAAVCGS